MMPQLSIVVKIEPIIGNRSHGPVAKSERGRGRARFNAELGGDVGHVVADLRSEEQITDGSDLALPPDELGERHRQGVRTVQRHA